MKKTAVIFLILLLAIGCAKEVVAKPENLIEKDKMADIIFDLAILEAIRSQKPIVLEKNSINQNTYVYKKYSVDSIQFAKSNQYYASDIVAYKEIYNTVAKRLESQKAPGSKPSDPDPGVIK